MIHNKLKDAADIDVDRLISLTYSPNAMRFSALVLMSIAHESDNDPLITGNAKKLFKMADKKDSQRIRNEQK